ncbi:MAG TPA: hypothetical protein VMU43_14350 [Candidatus Acidoferrum sp.]|nr:hypothetical protein [Candidatus Acidoferrum sp.]
MPRRIPSLLFLKSVATLLAVVAPIPAASAPAQSADKIVGEYLRAMGGAKSLEQIRTTTLSGTVTEAEGGPIGSYSLILKSPDKFYLEILLGPLHFTEAFDGRSAWTEDGPAAPHTLTGAAPAVAAASAIFWNSRLARAKKDKIGIRFVGEENIAGRNTYHLQLSFLTGVRRDLFFDEQTHLLVREVLNGAAQTAPPSDTPSTTEFDYSDYHLAEGVPTPHAIDIHLGARILHVAITRVEFNSPAADSAFAFPTLAGRPLPDIPTLLRDVVKNQDIIENIQKQYTCRVEETEEKTDSKGQVTSTTVSNYDVFYIAGEEVRHLVAKNGQPLTGEEKQKEDDRFDKEFDKLRKKQEELAADPKKQQREQEEDEAQISDFLRAERFTNPRRERFRGQDVIVFDFGPNPEYKPHKLAESIVQKLVGVIWVDEQARDVVRLEAEFSDNAKIAGGLLASLSKGSNFVFEQSLVNSEVWLPSYFEVHASARVLFVHAKANVIDRYSNYRKFQVETQIGAPIPNGGTTTTPPSSPSPAGPSPK